MAEVGVQDLHDHLSRHLRRVRAGEEIVVTNRGRRIARISAEREDPWQRLVDAGAVSAPTRPKRPIDPAELIEPGAGTVSDLVNEQRR